MFYKLKYCTIETTIKLSDKVVSDLSGAFLGGLQQLIACNTLPKKSSWLVSYKEYYYAPGLGLVKASDWMDYLPKEFIDMKKTITQVCVEMSLPRSFARFLNTDSSFYEFTHSDKYRHFLGMLNHTKHVKYGELSNIKKSGVVRVCDRRDQSWKRVGPLIELYDYTLLDEWTGTRNKDGSLKWYTVKCNHCGTEFKTWVHGNVLKVCPGCKQGKFSAVRETQMKEFIESFGITVWQSVRGLIKSPKGLSMELDLYLPDYKIAFEFNGYRYHVASGENAKPKDYHQYKTVKCLEEGIKLYHIWSDTSDDLCKSIIQSKIGKSKRIFARKTVVGNGNVGFHKENHVDGDCRALKRFSLFYNDYEVAQLSLRRHKEGLEIARFSTVKGYTIVGGYSKLLFSAMKWAYGEGYTTLITYCNRDLSPDPRNNFYSNNGFHFIGETSLLLKYTNFGPIELDGKWYKSNSVISRQRCQKHILMKQLGLSETSKTEGQLAEQLGLYQVFNSGNFKYEISIDLSKLKK